MCLHSLDRLLIAYVRGISAIITSVCFAYIGALYINCIHGQRDTIFGFKFFWLEDGSDTEYYINLAFQIFFAMYFILGNIVVETGASLHENNISLSTEIIKMDITRLSEDVEYGNITEFAMKSHLRRIVWKFQAVNKLLKEYDESFYWRYFLSPVAFTYSIGLSVFAQYMVSLHCVAGIHRSHWKSINFSWTIHLDMELLVYRIFSCFACVNLASCVSNGFVSKEGISTPEWTLLTAPYSFCPN